MNKRDEKGRFSNSAILKDKTFGLLKVIEKDLVKTINHGSTYWKCLCECGKTCFAQTTELTKRGKISCGCKRKQKASKNLIGLNFPNFEVLKRTDTKIEFKKQTQFYMCKCKHCGKEVERSRQSITSKFVKSCGCLWLNNHIPKTNKSTLNTLYNKYSNDAGYRDLEFTLTKDDFKEIIFKECFYCGINPSQSLGDRFDKKYNGIDRIDNLSGYIKNNCTPCCGMCNSLKSGYSQEDFIKKVSSISENMKRKNNAKN